MSRHRNPADHSVGPTASLRDVAMTIDRGAIGIALVLDDAGRVVDTVTDGDLRRAVLAGQPFDQPVSSLASRRTRSPYAQPITASVGLEASEIAALMAERKIRQLPLVDESGRVVDLVVVEDLTSRSELPVDAVVMAGGFGKRLGALTQRVPKPMLPLGDKPLLEHTIGSLRDAGIRRVHLTTHYRAEVIKEHFGAGDQLGVEISYVDEDQPLGTAGALGLLPIVGGPILVLNGDLVTRVDYRALLAFHQEQRAAMTVGVRQYEVKVPYGVVESEGALVRRVREKPTISLLVNAGIYLLEPEVVARVPAQTRLDMPELIQDAVNAGMRVASFPVLEYWLDIGQVADYARARDDYENAVEDP